MWFKYHYVESAIILILFQHCVNNGFLAWAWLAKAKGHSCHTKKINPCQNIYGKKRVKVRCTTGHYASKNRPVKMTMYLGLDIIIKLKLITNFDRCAILNVLNYLIFLSIQSTLGISRLMGPSKTLRDIHTSTYQIFRIEENTNRTTKFHKYICNPLVSNIC